MLKIFISLIAILFLSNVEKSLANQEDAIEIEIPITKNEESKITNKNITPTNKKKFTLNNKKPLGNDSNFQKTKNLFNINNKKTDDNSGKANILGTVKKSINPEKNKPKLATKKTIQNSQDKQNQIVENKIINPKKNQSNIENKEVVELNQKSLESKQILEPIADIEVIEDDKISKLRQKKLQQENISLRDEYITENQAEKMQDYQKKAPQKQLKNIFQEPTRQEDKKNYEENLTEENKTENSSNIKSKLSPFKPRKPTPARFFSADLSAPETFFSSNNLIKKTGSFYRGFGEIIFFRGTITDSFGVPINNAIVEIWQANSAGKYHSLLEPNSEYIDPYFNMSGKAITNNVGEYNFITIMPGSKVGRAPHININVYHPKFGKLETESYFENHPNNKNDYQYTSYDKIDAELLTAKVSYSEANNPKSVKICTFNIVLQGTHQYKKY